MLMRSHVQHAKARSSEENKSSKAYLVALVHCRRALQFVIWRRQRTICCVWGRWEKLNTRGMVARMCLHATAAICFVRNII